MTKRGGPSRVILTLRSLLFMGGLGASLSIYSVIISHRDVALALGPQSSRQESFFVDAADRPDIKIFYQKLTDSQKVTMANNIGRYRDQQLAKLCAILLGDFSANARSALSKSLTEIGQVHPDSVAKQLGRKGSFEQFGIREALARIGTSAIPDIVATFDDDLMRPNAEDLLVSEGPKSIPILLPILESSKPKSRMAAVDILGKLRAKAANPKITALYLTASSADREPYLVALSSIGDPNSEALLTGVLKDPSVSPYLRSQAALGLGRIASPTSVRGLWQFALSTDATLSQGCLSALLLCQDKALIKTGQPESLLLAVATGVHTRRSDEIIRSDLHDSALQTAALAAAAGRPELVSSLKSFLLSPENQENGDAVDAAVKSLLTTPEGKRALQTLISQPLLAGFIRRRQSML